MILFSVIALLSCSITTDAQFLLPRINFVEYFPSAFTLKPFATGFPDFFPEFRTFMADFFKSGWGKELEEKFKEAFKNAVLATEIESTNGTTTITLSIGGKKYMKSFPAGTSYALSSTKIEINGKSNETVRITVDGTTSVYTTVDGKTTVTDGKGNPLPDGGIFGVKEIVDVTQTPGTRFEERVTESLRRVRRVMRS
ncbi:hypothetical protein KIN20_009191 [Parelaphostrongylus tenuis]|uniref:Uncharacterized protein n=1 Tax=Parelaphostrongylus tenuis TaxID=148309 RepID=A0AAD5QN76_PARTN|nr:hypothetical protein KIN20_009191 [Parelaphostrongylus tenuis]